MLASCTDSRSLTGCKIERAEQSLLYNRSDRLRLAVLFESQTLLAIPAARALGRHRSLYLDTEQKLNDLHDLGGAPKFFVTHDHAVAITH